MITCLRFALLFTALASRLLAADDLETRLEQLFGPKASTSPRVFGPAVWLQDGQSYTVAEPAPDQKAASDLVRYEIESGKREVVVTAAQLTPPGTDAKPLEIAGHAWSKDERWLLIYTNAQKVWRQKTRGDYWLLDRTSGKLRQLGGKSAAPASLMFAKFSPDGTKVAYVRASNLYVEAVSSGAIRQLTTDGSAAVFNGIGDWVNEEELRIRDAYRWSDDSRLIAYWQFDTSGVGEFTLPASTDGLYPRQIRLPYPKPGTRNSAVRIGVVAATGGRTRWMDLPGDPREHYVARLSWLKDRAELAVHQLNRLQNTLHVYLADARTGKTTPLYQDRDDAWVSVAEESHWSRDGRTLYILSERDGWQQAYAVSRSEPAVRRITNAPADVIALLGPDAADEWLYYIASPENATQRHLYRTRIDGSGAAERLSPAGQPGTHSYVLSPDARHAVHTYSRFDQPPVTNLIRLPSHEVLRQLRGGDSSRDRIADLARPAEFFTVGAGDGVTLDGWMIKPKAFDPALQYPVVVFIYGEISVRVTDAWNGSTTPFHWALADAGAIVVCFDNRGTPAPKGRAWRKVVYGQINVLGAVEQTNALKELLRQRPYLDGSRVGVWGHSGGGANTLHLLFRSPDTYRVGVAQAPVTDVRHYDTIYQERYMGLPETNAEGYRKASAITYAAGLRGKLLLMHGEADDNVHYHHTRLLANRLIELQKPFDLMVYPNGTHALSEGKGYTLHRYRTTARYLQTHLPFGARPAAPVAPGTIADRGTR